MTCYDCIHDGVCHIQEMSTGLEMEEYLKEFGCDDFKNKADFVEVVRCKDCKYYFPVMYKDEPMHYGFCNNTHDDVLGNRHRYEGDFCSYGEKGEKL